MRGVIRLIRGSDMPPPFAGYRYQEQMEAIALQETDENRHESYYIRTALDNMRRFTMRQKRGERVSPGKVEEISYRLACYTKSIKYLYDKRNEYYDDPNQVRSLVFDLACIINGGIGLLQNNRELPAERVDKAISDFALELRERLNNPAEYDPIETAVLIEYRLRYTRRFFVGAHRSIAEALVSFFLIRERLRIPEYVNIDELTSLDESLPDFNNSARNIDELTKDITALREDQSFCNWIKLFREQFSPRIQEDVPFVRPTDPWKVKDVNAMDGESTAYNRSYVTRTRKEIDRLRKATGRPTEDVVVFRPNRIALHETIAAAVTKIQLADPPKNLHDLVVEANGPFKQAILPRIQELFPDKLIESDIQLYHEYVKYSIKDYFHIVNPNIEMRRIIGKAKSAIIKRIRAGSFDPRLIDTRDIMIDLVSDELLRRHYQKQVRELVDNQMEVFLEAKPGIRLPLKPNAARIAWVLAGGIAAGKTTLERLILGEYANIVRNYNHLCQINSDHYKSLLMEKTGDDPGHGSKTRSEALRVRDLVLERLREMINVNLAPDFLISTVAPVPKRMNLASEGGAKVNLYLLSCPAEGYNGSVQRAFRRANDKGNSDAYNRFVSTQRVLESHRTASIALPEAIAEKRRDLRLFNTASEPTELIASMDSHNRELRLFDPKAFFAFIKKSFLNENAQSKDELYQKGNGDPHILATAFCKYCECPKPGVCFNFRYGDQVPNTKLESIHGLSAGAAKELEQYEPKNPALLIASQIETYAWIGHDRADVHDIDTFVSALGKELAEALLIELSKRWPLKVRDYIGNLLFIASDKGKNVDYDPRKVSNPDVRSILDTVAVSGGWKARPG